MSDEKEYEQVKGTYEHKDIRYQSIWTIWGFFITCTLHRSLL